MTGNASLACYSRHDCLIGEIERGMFGDFDIQPRGTSAVLFTGDVDQSALYGAPDRIRVPGLELAGLRRLSGDAG